MGCLRFPLINKEPSELYKELLDKYENRQLVNLIYAYYSHPGVAAEMDNLGMKRNSQNEHNTKDVIDFFDADSMSIEDSDILLASRQIGAIDNNDNLVNFNNAEDALMRAKMLNDSTSNAHRGGNLVAMVVRKGDSFNIIVNRRDSRTQRFAKDVKTRLAIWDIVKDEFNNVGINLKDFDFYKTLFNALNAKSIVSFFKNISNDNISLSKTEINVLLNIEKNSTEVQRLLGIYGNLDNLSEAIYNFYHNIPSARVMTNGDIGRFTQALSKARLVNGLDLDHVQDLINDKLIDLENSDEYIVDKIITELHQKYKIDKIEKLVDLTKKITKLSSAAEAAATVLQIKLNKLKRKEGVTDDVKNLQQSINKLLNEIENKKYYIGSLDFLAHAKQELDRINQLYSQAINQNGTVMQQALEEGAALEEIQNIVDGFITTLEAYSEINKLILDEDISNSDIANIESIAKPLYEQFKKYRDITLANERELLIKKLVIENMGEHFDEVSYNQIVAMAKQDVGWLNFSYSVGRSSNPLISLMGQFIRDAQDSQLDKLRDISLRIRRLSNLVGNKTNFIYESTHNKNYLDSDMIVSDIDWVKYREAYYGYKNQLIKSGISPLQLQKDLQDWVEANTEERIVNFKDGRTERVPNSNYRKENPYDNFTDEQKQYYNEIMQIKGELGSLLPEYARNHYLPPQIRRSFFDAIGKRNGKSLRKILGSKIADKFLIREDDMFDALNGYINGEELINARMDYDGTKEKEIPIFFVNKLKDQRELMKDFSHGILMFAKTAINYDSMNEVKGIVETIGRYVKSLAAEEEKNITKNNKLNVRKLALSVDNGAVHLFRKLLKVSKTNLKNTFIVDGFIDQHLYGKHRKDLSRTTKLEETLLAHNSSRRLTANTKGAGANLLMGVLQNIIEAGAGEFMDLKDLTFANKELFGKNLWNSIFPHYDFKTKQFVSSTRLTDFLNSERNDITDLLGEKFNILNDSLDQIAQERFFGGAGSKFRKALTFNMLYTMYGIGEYIIHYMNMYAILHHNKIRINGEEKTKDGTRKRKYTLMDLFYVGNKIDGSRELLMHRNAEYKDSEGNWVPIDDNYIEEIKRQIRYCNQTCHGSMNKEDHGIVHQYFAGKAIMNLRQWMVEHYSRRFRKKYWDASAKQWREGYYRDTLRLLLTIAHANKIGITYQALRWNDIKNDKKRLSNFRRAVTEHALMMAFFALSMFVVGDYSDHKDDEWWKKLLIFEAERCLADLRASTPWFLPQESLRIVRSPAALISTLNALMYPIYGIMDLILGREIKGGKHKGEKVYWRKIKYSFIPYMKEIEQMMELEDSNNIFSSLNPRE